MNVEKHPAAVFEEGTNQSHPSTRPTPFAKKKPACTAACPCVAGCWVQDLWASCKSELASAQHDGSRSRGAQWCATDESSAGSETSAQHGVWCWVYSGLQRMNRQLGPKPLRSMEFGAGVCSGVQQMNRRLGPRPLRSMEFGAG
eukprot:3541094-Pleurochrysis_carterae.AAC.1